MNGRENYIRVRKSIYASINARKGNLVLLLKNKSSFLSKEEKIAIIEVIDKMENLRVIYFNNRGKKNNNVGSE